MAIDATIGGASANSFVTLAEYQDYRATFYGIDGTEDDLTDEMHVLRACRHIERAYVWLGQRVTSTQAREWPRYISGYVEGFPVPTDAIPQAIKDAQCELAYQISQGATPDNTLTNGAVVRKREKVDVIEEETVYAEASREREAYPVVDGLVSPYALAKRGARAASIGLVRA